MTQLPSLREMLEAGVHFGHKTSRWHPSMEKFIFTKKSGVHIINLEKTEEELIKAIDFAKKIAQNGGTIVFIGTKKQSQAIVKKAALDCGMPYVNKRWIGGTLTNFSNILAAINRYKKLKEEAEHEKNSLLSKKERARIQNELERSEKVFGGLVNLVKKPDAFILFGAHDEKSALAEATKEKIPSIAICDTNADITDVAYPIPANDDATKSIELFANLFSRVIKENKGIAKAK